MGIGDAVTHMVDLISDLTKQKQLADQLVKHGEAVLRLCKERGIDDDAVALFSDMLAKCHYNGIGNE